MKKLNKIYIAVLSTILLLSACNKQLDLKPYQSIEQSSAILTAQDVQITLVGAYNRAGLTDLYGGGIFIYPDMMASQTLFDWQGTFQTQTQMVNQAITIDNTSVNATWFDGYQVINQANNVLANLDKVGAGDKSRTQGEAEFLRGMTYFDLARLFGRDWNDGDPAANLAVPIVLTPTTAITPASYVARATVSQVYAQAIADLKDAEAKLPASNTFFANKYAAAAILARLYMQKSDYADAIAEATNVISSGAFALNANYADEFPNPGQQHVDNTPEDIFAIQITPQQGFNTLNEFYASSDNAGRGDIIIKGSFVAGFAAGDTRAGLYNNDSAGILRCDKFDNVDGNVHVIRLAELYLIRAEANLRLSTAKDATPVSDVNKVRVRAGLAPLATVAIADVMTERVHELAFEGGFFLYDAKRTSTTANPVFVGALPAFSPKLVFPIPQTELNANPKLVQNPGYGSN
jgi:tetratricopeptide (TPR) repeat protein